VLVVDISFWVTNLRLLDSGMRPTSRLWGCMQGDMSADYVNNSLARRGGRGAVLASAGRYSDTLPRLLE
jgi:hypothetical protein